MTDHTFDKVQQSVSFLKEKFSRFDSNFKPTSAVVLGSGLADALPDIDLLEQIEFSKIPGFLPTAVAGHKSEIRFGHYKGAQVVFLRGRNHAYEGFSVAEVVHNVRVMAMLDIPHLLMTNAAGCLVKNWPVGALMLIKDHINFTGLNALSGRGTEEFKRPRFLDMSNCYCPKIAQTLVESAESLSVDLLTGVYLGVLGPSYETPAEVKMMGQWGAHAVGMSTVLEAMAAHHLGMKVGVISCLTNLGAGLGNETSLSHEDVLLVGRKSAFTLAQIVTKAMVALQKSQTP